MDKLTAVTLIMVAAFAAQVLTSYFRSQRTRVPSNMKALSDENTDLKARIAALEAIVTDPGYELKREIARL
ncbi:hypothetical protein SHAM105786_12905 [Shewanella amazonensis]|uniref:Phage shock protein B n=1 Tax=Shewanella amazonensis (strain ATCC BAA-1098 / SB2B) TaxID=326297 RepID=A1SBM4_SHEAM|nr:hypothetical protein [Shewanella amazonensis]ABM01781.1 hypothetical protein Sama_3578 [Shewanella amazonensis SB2B]